MNLKGKSICPHCDNFNWSGREYCSHCSGEIHQGSIKKDDRVSNLFENFPLGF